MDRSTYATDPDGGIVIVNDVRDEDGFVGRFWVEFAQIRNKDNPYMVDAFSTKEDAQEKAGEVAEMML